MTALTPKARALVERSRSALRPSARDRERIESALRERLGPEALPADAGVGKIAGVAGTRALFRIAIGVCVVGGGVAFWELRPSASPPESKQAVFAPQVSAPSTAADDVPSEPEPATPTGLQTSAPASPPAHKRDPLAQEVALLARATQELHLGHAAKALKALDEHQRRFPSGTLSEERRAARAQALCSMGRVRDGRVEQSSLDPQSPAAARAREVCDSASATSRAGP